MPLFAAASSLVAEAAAAAGMLAMETATEEAHPPDAPQALLRDRAPGPALGDAAEAENSVMPQHHTVPAPEGSHAERATTQSEAMNMDMDPAASARAFLRARSAIPSTVRRFLPHPTAANGPRLAGVLARLFRLGVDGCCCSAGQVLPLVHAAIKQEQLETSAGPAVEDVHLDDFEARTASSAATLSSLAQPLRAAVK
jgi:hypothetical protein